MAMADVVIRGAGIFGLSIAFACLKRGAQVQVVDPRGVAMGASGGIVGALAPHVPENWNAKKAFQLESLLMAERFWAQVQDLSGADPGYGRIGRLQPLADDRAVALAHERAIGAKTLWQGKASWQVVDEAPFAWRMDSPTGHYVLDTLSARLHPRRACLALAGAIEALGGGITNDLTETGAPEIWATGWEGLAMLSTDLGRAMGNGVKGQAALFDARFDGQPQLFVDGLHIIPHSDGTVAVGSTSERDFDDAETVDDALEDLVARARSHVAALQDRAVIQRWAGVRPRARSRAPMLGAWPNRAGHFIANGGFKIGFGMAPKVADVMADLVLDGVDQVPEGFNVSDN